MSSRKASVERALAELPPGAAGHAVDLTDTDSVQTFFGDLGDIDHLVYTAGESLLVSTLDVLDLGAARRFFDLRYFGALTAAQAAAPHLRPGGSITLTTGGALARPRPGWSVAVSVLGAVDALTRALAVELAPDAGQRGVPRCRPLALWDSMTDNEREEFFRTVGSGLLTGRVGEVSEIARGYLSLITQPYATGTVLTLDGGGALI